MQIHQEVRKTTRCSFRMITTYLCFLFHIVACAVAQRNNSTLLQNGEGCTISTDWLGHSLPNHEDCSATINKLYRIELLRHGMNKFEFIGKGASPEYKFPVMHTPRRYTVGKPETPTMILIVHFLPLI